MSSLTNPITCEEFETNVSEFVDGALSAGDRVAMETHMSRCDACTALHSEISAIVAGAATLPLLNPSRDLWRGIAERLDTPIVAIGTSGTHAATRPAAEQQLQRKRHLSLRQFAAAAVLIVAASSGATFMLTRASNQPAASTPAAVTPVASAAESAPATEPRPATPAISTPANTPSRTVAAGTARSSNAGVSERSRTRYAANDGGVDMVYEREITAMRRIVDERLGDLDSVTVAEIERNLKIIDKAIADSRRALEKDPRSRFLSSQLDRALETKLGVLRRIALL